MKKLVSVQEVEGEGLTALMGENVLLFCMNYIYHGNLVGVNEHDVLLQGAQIVYETGPLKSDKFTDAQDLPNDTYVRTSAIEAYCKSGR